MEIKKIEIEFALFSGFTSNMMDGICHIKTLPYLTVAQAVEGSYDIALGDSNPQNTGNGGFFIAPCDVKQTIVHHSNINSRNIACRWIFLKIKLNGLYKFEDIYTTPAILPKAYIEKMNSIFNRMFCNESLCDRYICYYEIIKMLIAISKPNTAPARLKPTLQYIEENYRNTITVEKLAESANLSVPRFFSVFKSTMGISPIAYLNIYRLSISVELLLNTKKTITEIADMVGISDSVYFNKMFRKTYQMSPSKYREIHNVGK